MEKTSSGKFFLVETIILVAIIIVIAAIAVPSYQKYVRRSHYNEIVNATIPYQAAVVGCVQNTGTLSSCNAGTHHIPDAITTKGAIASLSVTDGIITIIPVAKNGLLESDTYILTPTITHNGTVSWLSSGGSVKKGYAK